MIDKDLTEQLMNAVRVKSEVAREEIGELAIACKKELEIAGVYVTDESDPLFKQVVKLYCKAHYGYDKDHEKFGAAYAALRDSMALSGEYERAGDPDG